MARRPSIGDVANGVFIMCAVIVTLVVVRGRSRRAPTPPQAAQATQRVITNWRDLATGGFILGDPHAPVRIVEFADFQCPFCRRLATQLDSLQQTFGDSVAIVFRNFPLSIHPQAFKAALAGECAAAQHRFPTFYHTIYARQNELGAVPWTKLAEAAQVPDTAAFSQCLESAAFEARVRADQERGQKLGIDATPTLVLDSLMFTGAPPPSQLMPLVRTLLHPN
jgi:protein-disulfide isomerase